MQYEMAMEIDKAKDTLIPWIISAETRSNT